MSGSEGLSANEIARALISMMAPEHKTLQSKAGYIDARPHIPQLEEVLLQRTAGPYIWVRSRHSGIAEPCPLYPRKRTSTEATGMSTLCHVWTAPSWQGFSSRLQAGRCSHVFGLFARHTRPLAIMPSADQVPVKTAHSRCIGTSGLS